MSIPTTHVELGVFLLCFRRSSKNITGLKVEADECMQVFTTRAGPLIDMYRQGPRRFEWTVECRQNPLEHLSAELTHYYQDY